MITRSKKFICNSALALFLLVLFAGCAQTRANVIKEGAAVEKNGAAVIKAINTSSDGLQVEVLTDKPLSYTYYKTNEPPKIVIDLAQTEPGAADKPIEVNAGNIKRIEVTKHEFTGGFLSRVELFLNRDESDFSVAADQVDKAKLVINLTKSSQGENAVAEANAADANTAPAQSVEPNEATQPQVEAKPAQETSANTAGSEATRQAGDSVSQNKVLSAVTADSQGIQLTVAGGIESYNAFKLNKPDRIVVDLTGVKSGIATKSIPINKFAVSRIRQGVYPDKVRIVVDAAKATLPPYRIEKNENGLMIVLAAGAASSADAAAIEPAKEPAVRVASATTPEENKVEQTATHEKKTVLSRGSAVEAIDFRIINDVSQIAIQMSGNCDALKPVKVSGGLSLTIKKCQVPARLQRMIDTSAFPSVVRMITPYQVKMKRGNDVRILVKLRQGTSSSVKRDGDMVYWEIKNPGGIKTAATSRTARLEPEVQNNRESAYDEAVEKPVRPSSTASVHDLKQVREPMPGERKVYTGRKVSLEFSDADIRKILQLIAEVSNLNFLIGDDVSGTISIKLVNVPWDQALDVILDSKGLEKKQVGNIMYIKPKGKFKTEAEEEAEARRIRENAMELKTRVFDINFASVGDIAKQFEKLKSERGSISTDDRTNRVIVTDVEDRLVQMKNLLKELDMPERQVMIEARIVEATSTFTRDLGVQWGLHYNDTTGHILGIRQADVALGGIVSTAPTTGTLGTAGGSAAGITFGTLGSDISLDLRLSAAATVGQVKVISAPKILTLNNKAAKITQGQNIPYATTSAEGTKTEWVEASLSLEVTPHVTADGTITMKIKANNDSPGEPVGSSTTPPINKKEATTEVQVKSGETTVIGGIYQDSDSESDNGTPFLKDIPLLGWLFKSNKVNKTKTELLIFITPRIVN